MPKKLPTDDAKPDEPTDDGIVGYLQYRGPQTSVTVDNFGVRFAAETADGVMRHTPLPVVEEDADDPPRDAVVKPVADALVDRNRWIAWGVVCETTADTDSDSDSDDGEEPCGAVFATPRQRNSHQSKHGGDADESGGNNE